MSVQDQLRRLVFEAGAMADAIDAGANPADFAEQLLKWGIRDRRKGGSVAARREQRDKLTALAVVSITRHPTWSDGQIARDVGISATWIRSNGAVQRMRALVAAEGVAMRSRTPKSSQSPRNTGPRAAGNVYRPLG